MRSAAQKNITPTQSPAAHAPASDPVARFTDNRPEAVQMKKIQVMANEHAAGQKTQTISTHAPVQGMFISLIYLHNGRAESMASINSFEVPREMLENLLDREDVAESSKVEIREALANGETRENRQQYPGHDAQVPGVEYGKHARKPVNHYGLQEDIFNRTEMPELDDTELITKGGTLFYKGTKQQVTGQFRYGIHATRRTLHIVSASNGNYRHSSTVKSASVLSAGDMTVNSNGNVVYIDNNSGHYAPEASFFINGMRHLFMNGYLLPGKVRFGINNGHTLTKYSTAQSAHMLINQQAPQPPVVQAPQPQQIEILD